MQQRAFGHIFSYEFPFSTSRRDVHALTALMFHAYPDHAHTVLGHGMNESNFRLVTTVMPEHHEAVRRVVSAWAI